MFGGSTLASWHPPRHRETRVSQYPATTGPAAVSPAHPTRAPATGVQTSCNLCRGRPAVVIAVGERWPGGDLRPALEVLLGAGAIIAALNPQAARSPEAAAAQALWQACRHQANEFLTQCASGQELTVAGFAADVVLAAQHDAQDTVPLLTGPAFTNDATPTGHP